MKRKNINPTRKVLGITHDAYVKWAFGNLQCIVALIRLLLPPSLVQSLDLDAIRAVKDVFTTIDFKELRADLVYLLPIKGSGGKYYVLLIEHKSRRDDKIYRQMSKYSNMLDESLDDNLVSILPVIIYNGRYRWDIRRRIRDIPTLDEQSRQWVIDHGLAPHTWRCALSQALVLGIGATANLLRSGAVSKRTGMSVCANSRCICNLNPRHDKEQGVDIEKAESGLQVILRALSEVWHVRGNVERFAGLIEEIHRPDLRTDGYPRALTSMTQKYIISHTEYLKRDVDRILKRKVSKEVNKAMVSTYQQIYHEGIVKGERIGVAKGEQIGVAKGRVEGEQAGITKDRVEDAIRMIRRGLGEELIEEITQLPAAEIERLRQSYNGGIGN